MLLGCIADDFTGATDLANTLTRRGMRTLQTIGIPQGRLPAANAVVIALKSRAIPAAEAVEQSLAACRWLKSHGAQQIYFKYCSTFDSTDQGNIGPVAEALLGELGGGLAAVCPAYPENGRTVYLGHLFVDNGLLSESSMRDHPLTPMHDANLVRVLAKQTKLKVGLMPYATVKKGTAAMVLALAKLRRNGHGFAIVDAVDDIDLDNGEACAEWRWSPAVMPPPPAREFPPPGRLPTGRRSSICRKWGPRRSCGELFANHPCANGRTGEDLPGPEARSGRLADNADAVVAEAVAWALERTGKGPFSSMPGQRRRWRRHRRNSAANGGAMIEEAMASSPGPAAAGVHRLVVAGGETSGAVVKRWASRPSRSAADRAGHSGHHLDRTRAWRWCSNPEISRPASYKAVAALR
jgi:uncharacterized protein YgbK (DUF1537 family)